MVGPMRNDAKGCGLTLGHVGEVFEGIRWPFEVSVHDGQLSSMLGHSISQPIGTPLQEMDWRAIRLAELMDVFGGLVCGHP